MMLAFGMSPLNREREVKYVLINLKLNFASLILSKRINNFVSIYDHVAATRFKSIRG